MRVFFFNFHFFSMLWRWWWGLSFYGLRCINLIFGCDTTYATMRQIFLLCRQWNTKLLLFLNSWKVIRITKREIVRHLRWLGHITLFLPKTSTNGHWLIVNLWLLDQLLLYPEHDLLRRLVVLYQDNISILDVKLVFTHVRSMLVNSNWGSCKFVRICLIWWLALNISFISKEISLGGLVVDDGESAFPTATHSFDCFTDNIVGLWARCILRFLRLLWFSAIAVQKLFALLVTHEYYYSIISI